MVTLAKVPQASTIQSDDEQQRYANCPACGILFFFFCNLIFVLRKYAGMAEVGFLSEWILPGILLSIISLNSEAYVYD